MVDQLNGFASEVTRVAREVGTDGKLGGQAHVPGVAGIWKDLTINVNTMAANLTGQVRAIAEVAKAVTKGDFDRLITVEAYGELDTLKSIINEMIFTLKDTLLKTTLANEANRAKSEFMVRPTLLNFYGINQRSDRFYSILLYCRQTCLMRFVLR